MPNYDVLHSFSLRNKDQITKSKHAGCFHCLSNIPIDNIKDWVDKDLTALCPMCNIDSLLPDSEVELSNDLLKSMHTYWFEE